jgi:hypothetical protein
MRTFQTLTCVYTMNLKVSCAGGQKELLITLLTGNRTLLLDNGCTGSLREDIAQAWYRFKSWLFDAAT